MRIKTITTACIIAAFLLMLAFPRFLMGRPHRNDPLERRQVFARQLLAYGCVFTLTVLGAGVGSVVIIRQAREEYREALGQNIQQLVETAATLKQHDSDHPTA